MDLKIESHKDEILALLDKQIPVALERVGLVAERYAKENCPTDTGRLKNSITHAVGGNPWSVTEYGGDRKSKYGGKEKPKGHYSGSAPNDTNDEISVYIGTNVEYAPYVELGTRGRDPVHFLLHAIENHIDEYQKIIEGELGGTK